MAEFLAGRNAVHEALRAGRRRIERVYLAEGVAEQGLVAETVRLCHERGVPVARVPRSELERLSGDLTHQGVVAQASAYPYVALDEILGAAESAPEPALILVLDSLQDPQNVGALLRTADAVGVHGVVIPERRAAQITPAVSRASAGAAEHLLVARVTNIARTLDGLKAAGIWVAGVEGRPDAQDYRAAQLDLPLALVLGSEGEGMRRLVAERCDMLLRIPMRGRVSSLNVSVAGALALYRAWHAREPFEGGGR
jgi:23S rRNA (guanosine2251-2'-O)-methyltransferase